MFSCTPEQVIDLLDEKFEGLEWNLGNSQTQPYLICSVEFPHGKLIVLLDRELTMPGPLIYAYGGPHYLFQTNLRRYKPNYAFLTTHEIGTNTWVEFTDEDFQNEFIMPAKLTHIPYGGNQHLVWHELR